MLNDIPYIGETLSLITAFVWALAVIFFKRSGESVHPIGLNLFKTVLAAGLCIPTLLIRRIDLFPAMPAGDYAILLVSGIIGIGVGDTLFFMSLNRLGAGLSAIVDCLYSPSVIILAFLFLGERLSLVQLLGVACILSAVLLITKKKARVDISRRDLWVGLACGALSMFAMGAGVVMVKPVLLRASMLWSMSIRLYAGAAVLLLVLLMHPDRRAIVKSVASVKAWGYTLSGSLLGGYLAMMLWLAGMKYTHTSLASALNQTSNIFIFILAALLLKEPVNRQRVMAIAAAVFGVVLVLMF